jgi:hypothetical protein
VGLVEHFIVIAIAMFARLRNTEEYPEDASEDCLSSLRFERESFLDDTMHELTRLLSEDFRDSSIIQTYNHTSRPVKTRA